MTCTFLPEIVNPQDGQKKPREPNSVLLLRGEVFDHYDSGRRAPSRIR